MSNKWIELTEVFFNCDKRIIINTDEISVIHERSVDFGGCRAITMTNGRYYSIKEEYDYIKKLV